MPNNVTSKQISTAMMMASINNNDKIYFSSAMEQADEACEAYELSMACSGQGWYLKVTRRKELD